MAIIVEKLDTVVPDVGTMVPHYMMVMDEDTLVLVAALIGCCCTNKAYFGGNIEDLYNQSFPLCEDKIAFADGVFSVFHTAIELHAVQSRLDEEFTK